MFSLKNLIGTPLKQDQGGEKQYEFTPIGGKSRVIPPAEVIRERESEREPLGRARSSINVFPTSRKLHDISVVNNMIMDSSFDDTTANLHNITVTGIRPQSNSMNKPRNSQFGGSKIVDNGMYSIKEQQNELQRLQTENYNLKIEVASLTKFLKQTPEEQRNMATENIELKQQLMESIRRIKELEVSVDELKFNDKENASDQQVIDSIKLQYKQIVEERDDKIEELSNKIEFLQNKQPSVSHDVLDKLEYLQGDNQALRRKLDDLSANLGKIPEDVLIRLNNANEENQILTSRIEALKRQLEEIEEGNYQEVAHNRSFQSKIESLKEEIQESHLVRDNLVDKINDMESERSSLQDKLRDMELERNSLHDKLREIELQRNSLADTLDHQKIEKDSLQSEIKALRQQLQNQKDDLISYENEAQSWKEKFRALDVEYDGVANTRNSAINSLKQELINLQDSKENEIRKLKRQVSLLSEDLEESKNLEMTLKAQLKAAVNSKADTSTRSKDEFYKSEISAFKSKEARLMSEVSQLKEELAEFQDRAYQSNVDSGRYQSLQKDHADLLDRIAYYEKEYSLVQDALKNAEAEVESLKKSKNMAIEQLEEENKNKRSTIAQLEEENSQLRKLGSTDNSGVYEIEKAAKRRAEQEKQQLIEEVDDLKFQLRRIQKELEFEKTNKSNTSRASGNNSYLESEVQKLSKEKNLLKLARNEDEIEIGELKSKCNKLQSVIGDKESLIESLESRIRDLNKQFKLHSLSDDRKSEDVFEVKKTYTHKLKQLEYEYEKLEADYKNQAAYYENKINELYDMHLKNDLSNGSEKFASTSPITVLLEQQLQHSRTLNDGLSKKLSDAISNESKLSRELSEVRSSLSEIVDKNEKLLKEKGHLEDVVSNFETDSKILKSENSRLELKTKNLANELNTSFKHCTKLANKLHEIDVSGLKNSSLQEEDILKAKRNNAYLRKQIDKLNQKLAFVKYSPPPSPKKAPEEQLLKHQLQYYRAILHDMNLKYNDLSTMNDFIMKAIKNSNQSIKDDLLKLAHCGIYPDYSSMDLQKLRNGGKVSFKIIAQFVLAMVKIKRRKEKAETRRMKLKELKNEIEKESIEMLAG